MRSAGKDFTVLVWLLVVGLASLPAAASARASQRHTLVVAATGGTASFDEDRGLRDEAMVGMRSGVGLTDRLTLWTDLSYSNPLRRAAPPATADVFALRMLVQVDVLRTSIAPYAVAGAGGVLYSFDNAASNGAGLLIVGGGVRYRTGRSVLFAEGRGEMSRVRSIEDHPFGDPELSAERTTTWNGSVIGGFGVEF